MKYAAVTKLIIHLLIAACITAINEFIVFCMGGSQEKSVLYFSFSMVKV